MGWLRQETAYERKMRELDEEAERIRKNMQTLMKSASAHDAPGRVSSSAGLRKRSSVVPVRESGVIDEQDIDSSLADGPVEEGASAQTSTTMSDRSLGYGGVASSAPRPERLASYLASGSFGKGGSLSRERRIQRNKAIFMSIVAIIALFSLYTWLK